MWGRNDNIISRSRRSKLPSVATRRGDGGLKEDGFSEWVPGVSAHARKRVKPNVNSVGTRRGLITRRIVSFWVQYEESERAIAVAKELKAKEAAAQRAASLGPSQNAASQCSRCSHFGVDVLLGLCADCGTTAN